MLDDTDALGFVVAVASALVGSFAGNEGRDAAGDGVLVGGRVGPAEAQAVASQISPKIMSNR